MELVGNNLEWHRIYYVNGAMPRGFNGNFMVKNPPCSGWQHAFVIPGKIMSTIFCPFTLSSFQVRNQAAELRGSKEPSKFDPEFMVNFLLEKWKECQSRGWVKDYKLLAVILQKLGCDTVPEKIARGGDVDYKKRGGKEVGEVLIKPVKLDGKRGQFLKWFMDNDKSRSVIQAMIQFDTTRSNVLSYLFMLNKDHGIGYYVVGDTATIVLPKGCNNPFDIDYA